MKALVTIGVVLFGLVLLTTVLRILWPNAVLFTLSLVFLANHLALSHGALLQFKMGKVLASSIPAGCSRNVALSYVGLLVVALASLGTRLVVADGSVDGLRPGNHGDAEEFQSLGMDEEKLLGSGGGGGFGDGLGSGDGDGLGSGDGEGVGFGDDGEGVESDEQDIASTTESNEVAEESRDPVEATTEPKNLVTKEEATPVDMDDSFLHPGTSNERHTFPFKPSAQVLVSTQPAASRSSKRGGGSSFGGPMASIDGSGIVVRPDKDTSILIFFDSSGSMNTTFSPLQTMRDTLLRDALLPCYGSLELYEEKVKVLSEKNERNLGWFEKGFDSRKSIVFVFQDESDGAYYDSKERHRRAFLPDAYHLRQAISEFDGSYYRGVLFQVKNPKEGARFQRFVRKTFERPSFQRATFGDIKNQMLAGKKHRFNRLDPLGTFAGDFDPDAVPMNTPIHVADYFRRSGPISFDVKYDVPAGSTPEYYLQRITVAAKRLGIDLSGGEPG